MKLTASFGLEIGSAVQADERSAEQGELDREFGLSRVSNLRG
jgi:hypothetical protein